MQSKSVISTLAAALLTTAAAAILVAQPAYAANYGSSSTSDQSQTDRSSGYDTSRDQQSSQSDSKSGSMLSDSAITTKVKAAYRSDADNWHRRADELRVSLAAFQAKTAKRSRSSNSGKTKET
ncbi:MAG: hypothetical protein PHY45_04525 [Rhodocyclaceae bacterium]|nr:hypothetical protein [Rhodocyclaceae bacterium]